MTSQTSTWGSHPAQIVDKYEISLLCRQTWVSSDNFDERSDRDRFSQSRRSWTGTSWVSHHSAAGLDCAWGCVSFGTWWGWPCSFEASDQPCRAGAASGSFWGMLIGLLFLNPLVGLAVRAGTRAASGELNDIGINDQFLNELGETLPKGSAALALLVREGTPWSCGWNFVQACS